MPVTKHNGSCYSTSTYYKDKHKPTQSTTMSTVRQPFEIYSKRDATRCEACNHPQSPPPMFHNSSPFPSCPIHSSSLLLLLLLTSRLISWRCIPRPFRSRCCLHLLPFLFLPRAPLFAPSYFPASPSSPPLHPLHPCPPLRASHICLYTPTNLCVYTATSLPQPPQGMRKSRSPLQPGLHSFYRTRRRMRNRSSVVG